MATTSVIPAYDVQIPPVRTNLTDPVVTNQTAKEWYFFWKQSGDRINAFNRMISYGNHADRLDPSLAPDGALYVESDRGDVLYEKHQDNDGNAWWQYVAGTMWNTLNPDNRPKDLGIHDAGFDYRTTDTDPRYGGREFIWTGTTWIEVTPVRYGTHADRLALTPANLWQGMLYVETDRSEVIYQMQTNVWHYLAGTMYGTISPDQRPTDLGANDAGFIYRSTDTSALLGGHEWIWSGSIWVEVTANRYGTHASRLAQPLANTWNGMIWIETDRGGAIYQNQSGVWHFSAGTMWNTLSPDNRPTDLGANDAGFVYRGTDLAKGYVWTGTAWMNTTGEALTAKSTGGMTLTTALQDVPGATLTLNQKGTYHIVGIFDFNLIGAGDAGQTFAGALIAGGVQQTALAAFESTNAAGTTVSRVTAGQQWVYVNAGPGTIVKLQAYKGAGSGTSQTLDQCTIAASWINP